LRSLCCVKLLKKIISIIGIGRWVYNEQRGECGRIAATQGVGRQEYPSDLNDLASATSAKGSELP
jgi:hypothetical protein